MTPQTLTLLISSSASLLLCRSLRLQTLQRGSGVTAGVVLALSRYFKRRNNRLGLLPKAPFQRPDRIAGHVTVGALKGFDERGHCQPRLSLELAQLGGRVRRDLVVGIA